VDHAAFVPRAHRGDRGDVEKGILSASLKPSDHTALVAA
jgi:hypothetical protein